VELRVEEDKEGEAVSGQEVRGGSKGYLERAARSTRLATSQSNRVVVSLSLVELPSLLLPSLTSQLSLARYPLWLDL
jgi:hypothetical protein